MRLERNGRGLVCTLKLFHPLPEKESEPMRISLIVGMIKDTHDELLEVLGAWDEYCIDSNPEGFDEAVDEIRRRNTHEIRIVDVEVSEKSLRELFKTPKLEAKLVNES